MRLSTRLRVYARFARYLLAEFRWSLIVFSGLVLLGGLGLHTWYREEELTYPEACFGVFCLIFLESYLPFPNAEWYLQPFFFLVPIVGLGAVADSVVRLAYLIFTQKQKLPEWQRMIASLQRQHVIVVGVGRVGFQIIKGLLELNEAVVAIEQQADAPLLDDLRDLGVPVIVGDGRLPKTLLQANVAEARAVVLSTNDDLANLDSGLTARDLGPTARIVLRLFDESLAEKISGAFAMPTISTAHVSAPAFIAAATGRKVYQELQLSGRRVHLTDLAICPTGQLVGRTVGSIQADREVNIVMHQGPRGVDVNPGHAVILGPDDTILVIAPMPRLLALEADNQPCDDGDSGKAPIVAANPAAAAAGAALAAEEARLRDGDPR